MNNLTPFIQTHIIQKVPNKPHIKFSVGYWRVSRMPKHPRGVAYNGEWLYTRWTAANMFACRLNEDRAFGMVTPAK